ncbi:hypothetical protein GBAR_LOCUS8044 [Geodia barretti]|uniref:Uncharacterized protein n=1 Tax=Geodia barretti TaxID=519541 RepID=A0AA35RL24_GEOBA|nr:hypothetical protein GBAR_LOCUS8044 [Geodia barretti]
MLRQWKSYHAHSEMNNRLKLQQVK